MVRLDVQFFSLHLESNNEVILKVLCRYTITLFNELYYLNSGGTVWTGV